jgi:hypothetical protein
MAAALQHRAPRAPPGRGSAGTRAAPLRPLVAPRALHAARPAPAAATAAAAAPRLTAPRPTAPAMPRAGTLLRPRAPRRGAAAAAAAPPGVGALPASADAVVVGAGLAGLHAAGLLQAAGLSVVLLEASDGPGGRVRSDVVDGFTLDRGFQIFLTGYPYARTALDYPALDLRPFYAGARVRFAGGWHTVADPLRHFVDGLLSLTNPIGSVADKVNVGLFRVKTLFGSLDALLAAPETTIEERLRVRARAGAGPCWTGAACGSGGGGSDRLAQLRQPA